MRFQQKLTQRAGVKISHAQRTEKRISTVSKAILESRSGSGSLHDSAEAPVSEKRVTKSSARIKPADKMPQYGIRSGAKGFEPLKAAQTRTERRLQRMQAEWRRIDAQQKTRAEEARQEAEEEDPYSEFWKGMGASKGRRKRSKQGRASVDHNDDPQSSMAARKRKASALVGLHDVVQEPPTFTRVPVERFQLEKG